MVKIDLITGFLGSGKTTFIRKYAGYLMSRGLNIGILENDYGAVNVDMMLLQDLMGDKCELEMISGGCDKETHIRRFRTKLISMGMCGYDRVIVEPSGIYDVDEFFDVLRDDPLDRWYETGNVITIVDAKLENDLSQEADYILASEAADAGKIILSHADEASDEQADAVIRHLNRALEQIKCKRVLKPDKDIIKRSITELSDKDFDELLQCGYVMENYQKLDKKDNKGFESLYFMDVKMTESQLEKAVEHIMNDSGCGDVFRVKGFMQNEDGKWLQLNATHNGIDLKPIEKGQDVLIVIGENLKEENVKKYIRNM